MVTELTNYLTYVTAKLPAVILANKKGAVCALLLE